MKTLLLFSFTLLFIQQTKCQTFAADSTKLEQDFLSLIGQPIGIDSMEKVSYPRVKGQFKLEDLYWYNLSKVRFLSGQLDAAFDAAEKGIKLGKKEGDIFKTAKFHNLEASVFAYKKDNEKAIASFKQALALVEEKGDVKVAASIRNNIANIFFGLSDYTSAYSYSKKAYEDLTRINDTVHLPAVTGIVAISALKLKRVKEGRKMANEALQLSIRYKNPIGLIVSHHSLGELHTEEEKFSEAITSFNASLKLSEIYHQAHFIMLNKLGLQHAFLEDKNFSTSIQYGEQALQETTDQGNENTLYAIHKNLGYAYRGLGQTDKGFYHLKLAHEIYIQASSVENQKVINDILIKYDTEKKEKALITSRLKNAENQNKLYKRMQWIILLGTVLALVVLSYYFYNRLQKQRLKQLQKEQESKRLVAAVQAEEKERERISNELHDGMASSITGIKMRLEDLSRDENGTNLKPLVNQLQELHDETRRMSHNLMPLGLKKDNWAERLEEYCRENSSSQFKIQFSNNLKKPVPLDPSKTILLYRSIQELIHNAQKYAQTHACIVQISELSNEIIISVEDEGIGFDLSKINGQGILSLRKRLKEIGAEMDFDSRENEGTLITISVPV